MHLTRIILGIIITVGISSCGKREAPPHAPSKANVPEQAQASAALAAFEASTPSPVTANTQPHNASPLGLEIGVANIAGVRATLGAQTRLEARGENKYSGGPMLWSNGDGLGVEGLTDALFLFDKDGVLAGVVMTVPKSPVDMLSKLSSKYVTVSNKINNFMGYGYARLQRGDSVVEIDSPHLSFTMEVRYLSKKLFADFARMTAEEEAKKQQEQTDKL